MGAWEGQVLGGTVNAGIMASKEFSSFRSLLCFIDYSSRNYTIPRKMLLQLSTMWRHRVAKKVRIPGDVG